MVNINYYIIPDSLTTYPESIPKRYQPYYVNQIYFVEIGLQDKLTDIHRLVY